LQNKAEDVFLMVGSSEAVDRDEGNIEEGNVGDRARGGRSLRAAGGDQ